MATLFTAHFSFTLRYFPVSSLFISIQSNHFLLLLPFAVLPWFSYSYRTTFLCEVNVTTTPTDGDGGAEKHIYTLTHKYYDIVVVAAAQANITTHDTHTNTTAIMIIMTWQYLLHRALCDTGKWYYTPVYTRGTIKNSIQCIYITLVSFF